MTSLQSEPGLAGRAPWPGRRGGGGDCPATSVCAGIVRRSLETPGWAVWRQNGAVASSSFLPACNYGVIAQSGIVGVDVYTQAVVQDVSGGERNAALRCQCPGQIWAQAAGSKFSMPS